jgi:hypothetical protein
MGPWRSDQEVVSRVENLHGREVMDGTVYCILMSVLHEDNVVVSLGRVKIEMKCDVFK